MTTWLLTLWGLGHPFSLSNDIMPLSLVWLRPPSCYSALKNRQSRTQSPLYIMPRKVYAHTNKANSDGVMASTQD